MDKNTLVKIANRNSGRVGYQIPEIGVNRQFSPRETKEITFEELEKLSFIPGGTRMLKDYLVVRNEEALKAIGMEVEPEYFYSTDDIKRIMGVGSLDEFLDLLDFAPDGVLDEVKDLAVSMPLNDMSKRNAILEKLDFDVTKAIEVRNTKFDGGDEDTSSATQTPKRRVVTTAASTATTARRTEAPKYTVVNKE
jgi:hypothetical protein